MGVYEERLHWQSSECALGLKVPVWEMGKLDQIILHAVGLSSCCLLGIYAFLVHPLVGISLQLYPPLYGLHSHHLLFPGSAALPACPSNALAYPLGMHLECLFCIPFPGYPPFSSSGRQSLLQAQLTAPDSLSRIPETSSRSGIRSSWFSSCFSINLRGKLGLRYITYLKARQTEKVT